MSRVIKALFIFSLLIQSLLSATTLNELIDSALLKSPSLEAIESKLEANKQNINISNQFANPELLLTKNTLDASEPMSKTVLTVKQKLPYYSKRDTNKEVALAEDEILKEKLHSAKVTLVAALKNQAYTLWELRELYKITDSYIALTQQNIDLYESYTSVSVNHPMDIMKAKLSLSGLKIQKSKLDAKIKSAYARLSYLASSDVQNLEIELKIDKKPTLEALQTTLLNNPELLLKEKEVMKKKAALDMASVNRYPDINLIAGYAYREKFDDYLNVGVSLSLPIYGSEKYKEQEARADILTAKSMQEDTQLSISSTLKSYYYEMLSAYNIYHIVQDDALPQVAHMFELSNSSLATGGDLFKYVDVLFTKLGLEQKSINAITNYNRAKAKIAQLGGALK